MSGKDLIPEYNPMDRAFETNLRSDFNSSSELFNPLSHCELFYDFHLQLVIKSVSLKSACITRLMNVSHKVTFAVVWRVRNQLFSLSMRFR